MRYGQKSTFCTCPFPLKRFSLPSNNHLTPYVLMLLNSTHLLLASTSLNATATLSHTLSHTQPHTHLSVARLSSSHILRKDLLKVTTRYISVPRFRGPHPRSKHKHSSNNPPSPHIPFCAMLQRFPSPMDPSCH